MILAQNTHPFAGTIVMSTFIFKLGRGLCGLRSAKTHLRSQVLPDRQGACLAARLGHRPASGIPNVFAHGQRRTRSVTAAAPAPAETAAN